MKNEGLWNLIIQPKYFGLIPTCGGHSGWKLLDTLSGQNYATAGPESAKNALEVRCYSYQRTTRARRIVKNIIKSIMKKQLVSRY